MKAWLIATLVVWCASIQGAGAQVVDRVVRVVDGDTVVLAQLGRTRLIGVDTPETVDPRRPVDPRGVEATAFLRHLAEGRAVFVTFDREPRDRFGRTLAYLYLEDDTFVNGELVRLGWSTTYADYPFRLLPLFRVLEAEARSARRGVWALP